MSNTHQGGGQNDCVKSPSTAPCNYQLDRGDLTWLTLSLSNAPWWRNSFVSLPPIKPHLSPRGEWWRNSFVSLPPIKPHLSPRGEWWGNIYTQRSITAFQQCPIITHINCTINYIVIVEIAESIRNN